MADPDQIVTDPNIIRLFDSPPPPKDNIVTDPAILKLFEPQQEPPKPTAADNIVGAQDAKPDDIAQANKIAADLNIPSAAVQTDIPSYEADAKRAAAIAEAEKNPLLKKWLEKHPDNAKISIDDLQNLGQVLTAVHKLSASRGTVMGTAVSDAAKAGVKGMVDYGRAGWGPEPMHVAGTPEFIQWGQNVGLWRSDQSSFKSWEMGSFNYLAAGFAADAMMTGIKAGRAGLGGVFGGLREFGQNLGLPNELTGVMSGEFIHLGGFGGVGHYALPGDIRPRSLPSPVSDLPPATPPLSSTVMSQVRGAYVMNRLRSMWDSAKPPEAPPEDPHTIDLPKSEWRPVYPNEAAAEPYAPSANRTAGESVSNNEPPHVGDSYLTDQVHIEQAKADSALMQRAFDIAQEGKLKVRSPKDLESAVEEAAGPGMVHIPSEVISQLYQKHDPHPEDRILGWADNIQHKVAMSQTLGTDLQIPLAQFVANVDPAVYTAIKDKIRLQEVGVSPEEAKALEEKDPEEYPVNTEAPKDTVTEMYERHPELFTLKRKVLERGRTGRPIKTERLPIGTEEQILEKGFEKSQFERAYHGTSGEVFTKFDPEKDAGGLGASYFSSSPGTAGEYVQEGSEGGRIHMVNLKLTEGNTLNVKESDLLKDFNEGTSESPLPALFDKAKAEGKSVIKLDKGNGEFEYAVLDPSIIEHRFPDKGGPAEEELPTDISAAMRVPKVPELPRPVEVPRLPAPAETAGPPPAPQAPVEAPKPVEAAPTQAEEQPKPTSIGELGDVVSKTLLDKAIKSIRDVTAKDYKPDIALTVDKTTRTVTVHDNGAGMSPDDLVKFLKAKNAEEELVLHANTSVRIYTLKDGMFSTVKSDGSTVRAANRIAQPIEPVVRPESLEDKKMFPDGHGTRVEVDIPNEYKHPGEGTLEKINMPSGMAPEDVKVKIHEAELAEPDFGGAHGDDVSEFEGEPETPLTRAAAREYKKLYLNALFDRGNSAGLDQNRFAAYSNKVETNHAEMNAKALKKAVDLVRKRLSPEWKADRDRIKAEVTTDYKSDPIIAAERYLRLGELPTGERVPRVRLDEKSVKALGGKNLDRYTVKKGGMHPDDVAPTVQLKTGKELVDMLNNFEDQRAQFGKSPREYVEHLIDMETNLKMEEQFGDLRNSILEEARDLVTTANHLDVLTDELKFLAELGGLPFTKDTIPAFAKEMFQSSIARETSYEKFRRAAEKKAVMAEKFLLKGKYAEAFQAKLDQYWNVLMAKEARVFEKKVVTAERNWKKIGRNISRKGIAQEYFDNARKIIHESQFMDVRNLQQPDKSLQDLVIESSGAVSVAPWMMPNVSRNYKNMTVEEVEAMINSIRSIMHVGAQAKKVDSMHGAADLDNILIDIENRLKRFPNKQDRDRQRFPRRQVAGSFMSVLAQHVLVERILDYSDAFDRTGPMTQFLDMPLRRSYIKRLELEEQVIGRLRNLEKYVGTYINDSIDNKHIISTTDDQPVVMTRQNLRYIMLWLGASDTIDKMTNGYNVDTITLFDLVHKNAREEDFHWVNGMHEMFKFIWSEAAPMIERVTGVRPEGRVARPWKMKLPNGKVMEMTGGYSPMFHDVQRSNIVGDASGSMSAKKDAIDAQWRMNGAFYESSYHPALPNHNYTLPMTNYIGWPDYKGTMMVSKIQQMLHDIAFRESVGNAQKIINNGKFKNLMIRYWGPEYAALMDGWLRDIANEHAKDDSYAQGFALGLSYLNQGVVNTLVGGNIHTAMKHGSTAAAMSVAQVGVKEMAKNLASLGVRAMYQAAKELIVGRKDFLSPQDRAHIAQLLKDPNTLDFIHNTSAFMRNRSRGRYDQIRGALERTTRAGIGQKIGTVTNFSLQINRVLVALADYVSANPLWLSTYKRALMDSGDSVEASLEADRAVTRAHGSSFPGDNPAMLRLPNTTLGQFGKMFMALSKYWLHATNNILQLAWDIDAMARRGRGSEPGANFTSILMRILLLAIVPIVMEEVAAPIATHDEKGGYIRKGFFATLRFFGSLSPLSRDLTNGLLQGREPSVGMFGAAGRMITDVFQDTEAKKARRDWVKHMITALGIFAVPFASQSSGSLAQGVYRQLQRKEHPHFGKDDYTAREWRALYTLGHIPRGRQHH